MSTRVAMRARTAFSVVLLGALLVAAPALAQQQADTLSLTLDDAVQRAVANNPELAIVRLGTEVEAARVG